MLLGARSFAQLATWFASSSLSPSHSLSCLCNSSLRDHRYRCQSAWTTSDETTYMSNGYAPWLAHTQEEYTHTRRWVTHINAGTLRHTHSNRNSMPACKRNHYYFGVDLWRGQWQWHTKAYAHTPTPVTSDETHCFRVAREAQDTRLHNMYLHTNMLLFEEGVGEGKSETGNRKREKAQEGGTSKFHR